MDSIQHPASSGSSEGGDPAIDERKRKRMESNREPARRSQMRKQKQLENLTKEASQLQNENIHLTQSIKVKEEAYVEMEAANDILKAQTMELADRLRFLNSVLQIAEDIDDLSVEIPQIPNLFFNPWQISHPMMPSPAMFLHGIERPFVS